MALATVATGSLGFGVWVHHMFATGLPPLSLSILQRRQHRDRRSPARCVFAWLATIWYGPAGVHARRSCSSLGFIVLFVIGGVAGFMTGAVPFDWQLTDTYFVVAHIHYVLIGIKCFPVFGGHLLLVPKFTGRMMSERLGRWISGPCSSASTSASSRCTSPACSACRGASTPISPGSGWGPVNMVETIGALVFMAGVLMTLANVLRSRRRGIPAGRDPWHANTLEWAAASPPEPYDFARIPIAYSRDPLWDGCVEAGPALDSARLSSRTTVLDARWETAVELPAQNVWTLVLSLAMLVACAGVMLHNWWTMSACFAVIVVSMIRWMWPRHGYLLETEV